MPAVPAQPSLLLYPKSDGGQYNPPERRWDEIKQEKCIRCFKIGVECGPNLTQFESNVTSRGKKIQNRKAKQSLDHDSAQSTSRARSRLGTPRPESSFHDDSTRIKTAPGRATFLAASEDHNHPESSPRVEEHGSPGVQLHVA